MNLTECPEGIYKITKLPKGNCWDRCISLGILSGSEIEVLCNSSWGPVVIRHNRDTLSIGRGMAQKIEVDIV